MLLHPGPPGELGPHEDTSEVHLEHLVPLAELDVDDRAEVGVGRGVVHEDVDAAELLDGGGDTRCGLVGLARVGREGGDRRARSGGTDLVGGGVEGLLLAG